MQNSQVWTSSYHDERSSAPDGGPASPAKGRGGALAADASPPPSLQQLSLNGKLSQQPDIWSPLFHRGSWSSAQSQLSQSSLRGASFGAYGALASFPHPQRPAPSPSFDSERYRTGGVAWGSAAELPRRRLASFPSAEPGAVAPSPGSTPEQEPFLASLKPAQPGQPLDFTGPAISVLERFSGLGDATKQAELAAQGSRRASESHTPQVSPHPASSQLWAGSSPAGAGAGVAAPAAPAAGGAAAPGAPRHIALTTSAGIPVPIPAPLQAPISPPQDFAGPLQPSASAAKLGNASALHSTAAGLRNGLGFSHGFGSSGGAGAASIYESGGRLGAQGGICHDRSPPPGASKNSINSIGGKGDGTSIDGVHAGAHANAIGGGSTGGSSSSSIGLNKSSGASGASNSTSSSTINGTGSSGIGGASIGASKSGTGPSGGPASAERPGLPSTVPSGPAGASANANDKSARSSGRRKRVDSPFLEKLRTAPQEFVELNNILGYVLEASMDQHGSRFIQERLPEAPQELKHRFLQEVLPRALALSTDVFGNYVVQLLFEVCSPADRIALWQAMRGNVLDLTLQMYGCRVVQIALRFLDPATRLEVVAELRNNVLRCIRDHNGNHVVQKAIEYVPAGDVRFIYDDMLSQALSFAKHMYGCRVVQRALEHGSTEAQAKLLQTIKMNLDMLVLDQYGNYVVQHVVEHGRSYDREFVLNRLISEVVRLSSHKYASNVIEKCFIKSSAQQRSAMVSVIVESTIAGEPAVLTMMKDQYANYVIQRILSTARDDDYDRLARIVKKNLPIVKRSHHGKHLQAIERRLRP